MALNVSLNPAQVHELDIEHAEVARAWEGYQRASKRFCALLRGILLTSGLSAEEVAKPREWRMVEEGDTVRLVAEEKPDGPTESE